MVELRKRKPKEEAPAPPPKKKSGPKPKTSKPDTSKADVTKEDVASAVQEAAAISAPNGAPADAKKGTTATSAPKVGDSIDLEGFGGEVETHGGVKTSLQQLVEDSKSGVVIFTYPKASTPGCKFDPKTIPLVSPLPPSLPASNARDSLPANVSVLAHMKPTN